jgi:apolipoprotein N-acyltransferase
MTVAATELSVTAPERSAQGQRKAPGFKAILAWASVGAVAFHAAYASVVTSYAMVVYLFALVQLARGGTSRRAYYSGLAVGLAIAIWRLDFFWQIFSVGAIGLWYVYAFWIGLFVALAGACLRQFGSPRGWLVIPFLWTGLEYFRSELYYLRFSWLNPGYSFDGAPGMAPVGRAGMYGMGFVLACIACTAVYLWPKSRLRALAVLATGAGGLWLCGQADRPRHEPVTGKVHIAGVQMECPSEREVLVRLEELVRKHPETELVVLSEYTFTEPVPAKVKDWCRKSRRYLVVGGEDPAAGNEFYDTAFVIGPEGEIVFRQAKCVPIQFLKDGLRATEQRLWDSPWGRIGLCICYDLSYTRVTDRLVRLGAQALIVPTMDNLDWGRRQHELHARVAPIRAAEYGLPIFRVASSGISQWVDRSGGVLAAGPCPGAGATVCGTLDLRGPGRLPLDRWLAPVSTLATGATGCWLGALVLARRFLRK